MNSTRIVVLVSGYGSNLQAILDACMDGRIPASVVAVISNKANAYGLERARLAGIPAIYHPKPKEMDRRVYDARLADLVAEFQPDFVVLAGWMRVLSNDFLDRFPTQVINLHPALPGTFPGTEAITRAFQAYQNGQIQYTGVMVHGVPDEGVDVGPVLVQEIVPIYSQDTIEDLENRIHAVEHRLLVHVLSEMVRGLSGTEEK